MRRILFLFFIFLNLTVKADYQWTETCLSAYNYASKLNFKQSQLLIAEEKKQHPTNQIPKFIESHIDFLKAFINENEDDLAKLKENNEKRISEFEEYDFKSPYQRLCVAEMYMQIALVRIKFEEYIGCVYNVRKAYKLYEKNQKEYPQFKPNLRGLGLIHAIVGAIPRNYAWAASLLGLTGTVDQGLGELNTLLAATYHEHKIEYLRDETIVMLTFLEMNLSKDKNSPNIRYRLQNLDDLNEKPFLQFSKAVFHISIGENDSVISILANRKQNSETAPLPYLDYMEGTALLNNLDYSAINHFKKFIRIFKGKSYVKSAWQRIAWIHLLQGDEEGYLTNMLNCKTTKTIDAFTDEDKASVSDANKGDIPNLILLRARLLFDGGYYTRALNELACKSQTNFPTQRDKLEFTYRLARIFDKQNKIDNALSLYEQTIKNSADYDYYFAAYSAFLIGKIYEDQHNKTKAIKYYKITLAMRDHEYQNSIDQKAKSGLGRLEH